MAEREEIVNKVAEIVLRAGQADQIEPVEVELLGSGNSRLLRIYIDKPEGVTHLDCERISEYVGTVLDVEDIIPGGRYTLEVSSPGVERKLARPKDFERFVGHKVKVVVRQPIEGKKLWEGALTAFDGDTLTVTPDGGPAIPIRFDQVARANLKFDW